MNEYSVLVYRVENGYRVDEFIYSIPAEKVVHRHVTSDDDIVDVSVKGRATVLTYECGLVRCIIDNSNARSNRDPSAEDGSAAGLIEDNKNEKDDGKMIKVEMKEKAIEAIGSIDYDDVLGHDDAVKIYESVSLEYDTLDALEND